MAEPQSIPNLDALHEAIHQPVAVVMKHSPICSVSTAAYRELEAFASARPDIPTYVVNVFTARSLARHMAAETGIRHASPQAFVFENGEVKWVDSHFQVTADALASQVPKRA